MTKYRITKKNSTFGWVYRIQHKFWFIWLNTEKQPFNEFDYPQHEFCLKEIINSKKEFLERKKAGNSVIIHS